jgi:DNA invertase Pin-like site-specific DNA recombinase
LLKPRRSFQRNQRHCGGPLHSARVRRRSERGLPSCHIEFLSFGYAAASTSKLTVLGGLAEFERELIRARTGEGRERAKAKGVKMGRKPKMTDHQKREAIKRRDHGKETLAKIGRFYNLSGWTISRLN